MQYEVSQTSKLSVMPPLLEVIDSVEVVSRTAGSREVIISLVSGGSAAVAEASVVALAV